MKVHVTNLYGQSPLSVALMSQHMVAEVGRQLGMKEIAFYSYPAENEPENELRSRFDGINAAVGNGDIVIFQSPTWNGTRFDTAYLQRLKIYAGLKIALFIHDVHPLMFASNFYLIEQTIAAYNMADLIIVPSQAMLEKLRSLGLTVERVLIQEFWDYPTHIMLERPQANRLINFAGHPDRFPFVNEWALPIPLNVFAAKAPETLSEQVHYQGWKYDTDLLTSLSQAGGFGLVWPQGDTSDYYQLNVSYKLSTYLAAGLPVIVPSDLSNADQIKERGLGFVIDRLEELPDLFRHMTDVDYQEMVERVWRFRELIIGGYFTKKLLIDAVHQLLSV